MSAPAHAHVDILSTGHSRLQPDTVSLVIIRAWMLILTLLHFFTCRNCKPSHLRIFCGQKEARHLDEGSGLCSRSLVNMAPHNGLPCLGTMVSRYIILLGIFRQHVTAWPYAVSRTWRHVDLSHVIRLETCLCGSSVASGTVDPLTPLSGSRALGGQSHTLFHAIGCLTECYVRRLCW